MADSATPVDQSPVAKAKLDLKRDFRPEEEGTELPAVKRQALRDTAAASTQVEAKFAGITGVDPSVLLVSTPTASAAFVKLNQTSFAGISRDSKTGVVTAGVNAFNGSSERICPVASISNLKPGTLPSIKNEFFIPPIAAFGANNSCFTDHPDSRGIAFGTFIQTPFNLFGIGGLVNNERKAEFTTGLPGTSGLQYASQSAYITAHAPNGAAQVTTSVRSDQDWGSRVYYKAPGTKQEIPVDFPKFDVDGYVNMIGKGISPDGFRMVSDGWVSGPNYTKAKAEALLSVVDPANPTKPAVTIPFPITNEIVTDPSTPKVDMSHYVRVGAGSSSVVANSKWDDVYTASTYYRHKNSEGLDFAQAEITNAMGHKFIMPLVNPQDGNKNAVEVIGQIHYAQQYLRPNNSTEIIFVATLDRFRRNENQGEESNELKYRNSQLVVGIISGAPEGQRVTYRPIQGELDKNSVTAFGTQAPTPTQIKGFQYNEDTTDFSLLNEGGSNKMVATGAVVAINTKAIKESLENAPHYTMPYRRIVRE